MGNTQTNQGVFNGNFKEGQWQQVKLKTYNLYDQPTLVKIPNSETLAQEYIITLSSLDKFQNHIDIYKKRASSHTNNLVNIVSAELLSSQNIQGEVIRVRTQRIPWRLTSAQNLTIEEGLYLIQGVCKGFHQLSQHFSQPFSVCPDMIGMNIFGTVRVWLNPNFAVNSLISDYQKLSSFAAMRLNIIEIIQQRMQSKYFPMRSQMQNTRNLLSLAEVASKFLNKSNLQKKEIAKKILKKFQMSRLINDQVEKQKTCKQQHSYSSPKGQIKSKIISTRQKYQIRQKLLNNSISNMQKIDINSNLHNYIGQNYQRQLNYLSPQQQQQIKYDKINKKQVMKSLQLQKNDITNQQSLKNRQNKSQFDEKTDLKSPLSISLASIHKKEKGFLSQRNSPKQQAQNLRLGNQLYQSSNNAMPNPMKDKLSKFFKVKVNGDLKKNYLVNHDISFESKNKYAGPIAPMNSYMKSNFNQQTNKIKNIPKAKSQKSIEYSRIKNNLQKQNPYPYYKNQPTVIGSFKKY